MSLRPFLALLPLALTATVCSAQQASVHAESKPGTDLGRYHTYRFADDAARSDTAFHYSSTNLFDLKQAVAAQLAAHGLRPTTEQPDLLVNVGFQVEQRTQTRQAYYATDGATQYIGQRNFHWQANDIPIGTYRASTATIDLVDAAQREVVWQGTTTAILSRTPSKATRQVEEGVAKVFQQYPRPAPR